MSTAYLPILKNASSKPIAYGFASNYDSRIAHVCLLAAAETRGIEDLEIVRKGKILVVWRGDPEVIQWPLRPQLAKTFAVGKIS